MPILTVTAGTPSVQPGTYLADLIAVKPKRMATQYSNPPGQEQDFLEWTWLLHTDEDDVEVSSLTTNAMTPRSRLVTEYLPALVGSDKVQIGAAFDTDKFIGRRVMVQTVVSDTGFAKIDKIVAAPRSKPATAPAPVPSPAQVTLAEVMDDGPEDDLPF